MGRLLGLVIGIFLISNQAQHCVAIDPVSIASTAIKIGKTVYDITNAYFNKDTSVEDLSTAIKNLNQELEDDVTLIMNTLKDLPSIIRLELQKETLDGHFAHIRQIFEEASRIKKEIDDGIIHQNNSLYERFATKEKDIDHSIYEIRRILTDSDTKLVLKQNFTETSKKFDNVCKIGMSHLQLLDSILGNLKAATVQYYLSKKFILEFLELRGEDNTSAKKTLLKNVNLDYSNAVRKFKDIMSTASLELWTCDPSDGYNDAVRLTQKTGPDFAELRIFSKYILSENNFVSSGECHNKKCSDITKLDKCGTNDYHFCNKVRTCPGKLIGCKQYTYASFQSGGGVNVCRSKDKNAYHRYYSVVRQSESADKFHCEEGKKKPLHSITFNSFYMSGTPCDYCDCLCEEEEYFVESQNMTSDIESNKVITGAKLIVENNILRLQFQQAKLLANGIINETTLEWKPLAPINKDRLHRISFDQYKKFALTPVINTDGGVVISMELSTVMENNMIYLRVGTTGYNIQTGALNTIYNDIKFGIGAEPKQQYNMMNRDVSTKTKKLIPNKPDSTEDQYVELSITDLAKDGGQSVIPFIDTRNVTANGPLSGASLYIRGQPGFGGFLAIKLYTFDIRKYVDSQSEI